MALTYVLVLNISIKEILNDESVVFSVGAFQTKVPGTSLREAKRLLWPVVFYVPTAS